MSRVFVAEEIELERKVVVKVLPPDLGAGLNIDRFRREIQLAAKLQHPHIVPLLAGGAQGALLYYTMPFIDGESLRAKLSKSRELPVHEAAKVLIEIADALAYAHSHSVVHRDIKPENVLMTGKHAVVTDFGVARALSNSTGGSTLTSMGVALGTPAYMAPEQAAADPLVDHRADIYALGVVGYELLTGRTPFAGLTPQMMLSAQVTTAPEHITKYRPNVPPQLAAVIMQCLEKNPADRLQSAEELRARLEAISTPSGGMEPVAAGALLKPPRAFRLTPQRIGVIAAAVGLVAAGLFAASTAFRGGSEELVIGSTLQVTSAPGLELHPAISPDGNMIAFVSGLPEQTALYVRQVSGGRTVRLTEDSAGQAMWPLWSPDGRRIAFMRWGQIFTVPALGGSPSLFIPNSSTAAVTASGGWSPDGTRFAFARRDTIYVANADGTSETRAGQVPFVHAIAWSPDGLRLAVAAGDRRFLFGGVGALGNIAASSISILPTRGGVATLVTDNSRLRTSPVWSLDGRHILYVSSAGGIRDIYSQRVESDGKPSGDPVRLTTGLNPHSISLSRDGRSLAYSQFVMTSNVYALPLTTRGVVRTDQLRAITSGNQIVEAMAVSADGRWLAFDSNLAGNQDIYKIPIAGGEVQQLTRDPADDFQPTWSPDGQEIAFHSFRYGDRDVFAVSSDGSATVEIAREPGHQLAADWSADGNRIAYASGGTGQETFLTVVERDTSTRRWGRPRRLAATFLFALCYWAPDGHAIAFIAPQRGLAVLNTRDGSVRTPFESGPDRPWPAGFAWSRDSKLIFFSTVGQRQSALWVVPAQGGEPRRLVQFLDPARQLFRSVLDADDQNFYVTIGSRESDVWVMELSKNK